MLNGMHAHAADRAGRCRSRCRSDVLDALTSVKVTQSASAAAQRLPAHLRAEQALAAAPACFLLAGGASIPLMRVIIVVTVNGTPKVLMDGVITQQQHHPRHRPRPRRRSTVTGEDLTGVMDFIDFSGIPYPAMPAEARVALIAGEVRAVRDRPADHPQRS